MTERELPIQRLMASGSSWSAIRAQGMSFSTLENMVEYSWRKLSFSRKVVRGDHGGWVEEVRV